MSDELLSAMFDGECSPEEVERALAAIEASPSLKARWSRMAAAREALSGTRIVEPNADFACGVMAAILADADADAAAAEPRVPKVVTLRRPAAPAVVAMPAPRRARRWQPVAGLAAAASITALAFVVGNTLLSQPVGTGAVALNRADVAGAETALTPVAILTAETPWVSIPASSARRLNDYLMEHSNARSESGMGGSLSYARLAVRSADYRPADEPR